MRVIFLSERICAVEARWKSERTLDMPMCSPFHYAQCLPQSSGVPLHFYTYIIQERKFHPLFAATFSIRFYFDFLEDTPYSRILRS